MSATSNSRMKQRLLYFFAGLAFASLCFVVRWSWSPVGHYSVDDWRWSARNLVEWLPWIAVAGVLSLRLFKGSRIKAGAYFLGTAIPMTILLGWLLFGSTVSDYAHSREFDAQLWRDEEHPEVNSMWPPRLCMVDDLLSSERLEGLPREQVLELLGPPLEVDLPLGAATGDVTYFLGPERGLIRIDSEWLTISFSGDDLVSSARLWRD